MKVSYIYRQEKSPIVPVPPIRTEKEKLGIYTSAAQEYNDKVRVPGVIRATIFISNY